MNHSTTTERAADRDVPGDSAAGTRPWLEAAINVTADPPQPSSENVDWKRLLESAEVNRLDVRLDPLVRARQDVPEATRQALAGQTAGVKILGMESFSWTLGLIDLLENAGIPTIPYKGPVLSERLYKNPAVRRFLDLDLIVPREHVPRTMDLLAAEGWLPRGEWNDGILADFLKNDCEISVFHPQRPLRVEVHWELLPPQHQFGLTMTEFWPRMQTRPVAGRVLRCFSVEDELLVLCMHAGEKHSWMRLAMVADVAQLIANSPELDWDNARAFARRFGREETLLFGAALAALVAGAPVPLAILREAASSKALVGRLALYRGRPFRVGRGLPSREEWCVQVEETRTQFAALGIDCALKPSRFGYVAALMRPDFTDRQAFQVPPWLSGVYWIVRPFRFARLHGLSVLKRV